VGAKGADLLHSSQQAVVHGYEAATDALAEAKKQAIETAHRAAQEAQHAYEVAKRKATVLLEKAKHQAVEAADAVKKKACAVTLPAQRWQMTELRLTPKGK
jgi:hypothetical protein